MCMNEKEIIILLKEKNELFLPNILFVKTSPSLIPSRSLTRSLVDEKESEW